MVAANPSQAGVEVEWQLDALDLRPVERWFGARSGAGDGSVGTDGAATAGGIPSAGGPVLPASLKAVPQRAKRLVDSYFDTEDWRIARSGYVLRTRRRGGVVEATMKDRAAAVDGLRKRMEATEALPAEAVEDLDPDGPVGRRVRALAGGRPLRQVLEVRTRRRLFSLVVHDERIGEVALDDTTIVLTGDPERLRLQRVEVEVLASWVDPLKPFVEQLRRDCGLQPATLSKFEAGLLAAGVVLPAPVELSARSVDADASLGKLAFTTIRRDTSAMLLHEAGTRLGDDPEALHQMRVSTRRLRAALDLFVTVLPVRAGHLREELGWLADVLGAVRDLDIQLGKVDEWCESLPGEQGEALDDLGDLLARHREDARRRLLEALESRRYERLVAGLAAMVEQGAPRRSPQARALAVEAMPELINERHRGAVRAAKRARASRLPADYHRLRIRCKRLRYAIEFTSGLYEDDVKRFAKKVAGLQDALGLIQDAEVAYGRLRTIVATAEGTSLSRPAIFAMGMVAERSRDEAERRLGALSAPAHMLRGRAWRRATRTFEDAKAAAADRAARAPAPPAPPTVTRKAPIGPPAVARDGGRRRTASAPAPASAKPVANAAVAGSGAGKTGVTEPSDDLEAGSGTG